MFPLTHLKIAKKYKTVKNGIGLGSKGILSKNTIKGETANNAAEIMPTFSENIIDPSLYIKKTVTVPNKAVKYPPAKGLKLKSSKTIDSMYVHKGPWCNQV